MAARRPRAGESHREWPSHEPSLSGIIDHARLLAPPCELRGEATFMPLTLLPGCGTLSGDLRMPDMPIVPQATTLNLSLALFRTEPNTSLMPFALLHKWPWMHRRYGWNGTEPKSFDAKGLFGTKSCLTWFSEAGQ